jgi:DNA-binding Xre family transcriptional regulator
MGKRAPRPIRNVALTLNVAGVATRRGIVARSGPKPGHPSVSALMRGAGIGYSTAYDLLRRPWRISRLDLGTLERVCQFYGCQPAELLVYDPDAPVRERPVPTANPLRDEPSVLMARLRQMRPVCAASTPPGAAMGYLGLDDDD